MELKDLPSWISAVAAVISAFGVCFAFWQLRMSQRVAQSQFEDAFASEYRDLASRLPTEALLGETLPEKEYRESFDEFFRYIDLSNEQVFLRQQGRVSGAVWENWSAGIQSNLSRPAFREAWEEIKSRCDSFGELRRLEREEFRTDPADW